VSFQVTNAEFDQVDEFHYLLNFIQAHHAAHVFNLGPCIEIQGDQQKNGNLPILSNVV
jgi:hypothetical protein